MLDCKTVRIFAHSSTREQSNKRSGMRLKTESETGERRSRRVTLARVRLLRHALPISLLILRKKATVFQSTPVPRAKEKFPGCRILQAKISWIPECGLRLVFLFIMLMHGDSNFLNRGSNPEVWHLNDTY